MTCRLPGADRKIRKAQDDTTSGNLPAPVVAEAVFIEDEGSASTSEPATSVVLARGNQVRAIVKQHKTGRSVHFELVPNPPHGLLAWLTGRGVRWTTMFLLVTSTTAAVSTRDTMPGF